MRTAAKTAALMALLTLGSKAMGFLRELFMAGFFGTSSITDAYVMASAIPGVIFAGIFTSVAVSYMPLFSEIVEKDGMEEGNRFTREAISLMSAIALLIIILGIIFSDQLVSIFAVGFAEETAALTSFYLKIIFPTILFTAIIMLLTANLQYKGVFLKPILAGYLQSVFVLAAIIVSAYYSHYFLAIGLLVGSGFYAFAVGWVAKNNGFSFRPTLHFGGAAKKIVLLAIPVFIGSTVNQINTFVDKMLASGLREGSVAALNYGNLLITLVSSMTITVIVTIIYPRLTQAIAREDYENFNDSVSKGMAITMIIGLPCSLGAMLYSHPVVQIVYERGAFDAASTELTGSAFFYYAIGLTFIAINALLVKVCYSMQDMKTPVMCGIIGAAVNICLNLLLVGPMAHRGLALATSIAAVVNACLLYYWMRRKYPKVSIVTDWGKMGKILLSAVLAVGISFGVYAPLMSIPSMVNIVALGSAVLAACLIYLILLKLFKIKELDLLKDLLKLK